jgi:2-deoxy-D-gluconate 3-dehydrogenase
MMDKSILDFSMDYFSLHGKTAIVTGGNSGLGAAYAVALSRAGANIVIAHRSEDVAEVKEAIIAGGGDVCFVRGDLTDPGARSALIAESLAAFGHIDILINNAGASVFEDFRSYSADTYRRVIEIDLNTVYYLGHEIGALMMNQGSGKIINIGSALSYTADSNCPPYVIAKHGVLGITQDFANEMGGSGVQCNCICPGFFDTKVTAQLPDEIKNRITSRLPGGKWGNLGDVMGPIVFLASKASDYINGWSINVDGGFTCVL